MGEKFRKKRDLQRKKRNLHRNKRDLQRNKYDLQWNIYNLYIKKLYLFEILSQNRIFLVK